MEGQMCTADTKVAWDGPGVGNERARVHSEFRLPVRHGASLTTTAALNTLAASTYCSPCSFCTLTSPRSEAAKLLRDPVATFSCAGDMSHSGQGCPHVALPSPCQVQLVWDLVRGSILKITEEAA